MKYKDEIAIAIHLLAYQNMPKDKADDLTNLLLKYSEAPKREINEPTTEVDASENTLPIQNVSNWVAVKDALPNNDNQVFVRYENGKYGINEWWEVDNCWKYQFDNMIVKEWIKPPCC